LTKTNTSVVTNNVLDWSRLESDGETTCKPVALDMRTVCESILTLLPNKDDDADVEMMLVVAPDVPPSLLIDETYINRILMNLLSNALKFTSSGYILLLIEMENDRLVATVKDTGIGVPPSFLPRLFEPFTQAQTRGSQRGTGLGLSIIKQLLQKMGGTIEVDSRHQETEGVEPGQTGSTFTITLPVQPLSSPQNGQQSNQTLRKVAIFHGGDERSLEGLCTAWGKFKFEFLIAKHFSDLAGLDLQYIWADLASLTQSPALFDQLLAQDRWLVLVPCDSLVSLQDVPGFLPTSRLVPIQKPLIWHAIESSIALASQPSSKTAVGRSVRFAPKVDVVKASENEKEKPQEDTKSDKGSVILLVEDNQVPYDRPPSLHPSNYGLSLLTSPSR
jgi:Histidine kinase-, DNA gyrase B-, and HSP90-like ATPase